MTLKQRIHVGFILAMAFLLVFASNRLSRRNFMTVEHTVNSVYGDRVVAQDYIYKMNNLFHKKERILMGTESKKDDSNVSKAIMNLLNDFETTKLTSEESVHFINLKENYAQLRALELNPTKNKYSFEEGAENITGILNKIHSNLDELSAIQLSEGRYLTELSNKSLNMNQLLSRLEIGFLIIIGILFLLIVLPQKKQEMMVIKGDS